MKTKTQTRRRGEKKKTSVKAGMLVLNTFLKASAEIPEQQVV